MRVEADFRRSLSALCRNRKTVLGLVGERSTTTGTVQFPRSGAQGRHRGCFGRFPGGLPTRGAGRARILSHTADHLCYSPDPPAYYGMIEFEGGGRMLRGVRRCATGIDRGRRPCAHDVSHQGHRHSTRVFQVYVEGDARDCKPRALDKPQRRRRIMPRGIRDKVAIIGMGCTRFGERWDVDTEQLIVCPAARILFQTT